VYLAGISSDQLDQVLRSLYLLTAHSMTLYEAGDTMPEGRPGHRLPVRLVQGLPSDPEALANQYWSQRAK
jgi:hypothetical protein